MLFHWFVNLFPLLINLRNEKSGKESNNQLIYFRAAGRIFGCRGGGAGSVGVVGSPPSNMGSPFAPSPLVAAAHEPSEGEWGSLRSRLKRRSKSTSVLFTSSATNASAPRRWGVVGCIVSI